jgi:hypothetical protein
MTGPQSGDERLEDDDDLERDDEDEPSDERDDEPEGARSLYVLPASRAPIAAVFLRVPGKWWHVLSWDLQRGELTSGAWARGTLYPRRSDLSPDGGLLSYFLAKDGDRPFMGMRGRHTFSALAKLPWVYALAAWPEAGTSTRGHHFVPAPRWDPGEPGHGELGRVRERLGLARAPAEQYATERRRGWVEHPECPRREPGDEWDEERSAVLVKPRPASPEAMRLVLRDRGWDPDAPGAIDGRAPEYELATSERTIALDDVVWADWHASGLLMVATEDSRLQVREPRAGRVEPLWERDLSSLEPRPRPAPGWAQRW